MNCKLVYEDSYGSVTDHVNEGYVELRWYDATSGMSSAEFKDWLAKFCDLLEASDEKLVLVDSTGFKMFGIDNTGEWREEQIIPRYNQHGVKKFAFHMPAEFHRIGAHPSPEGVASFPTGYFASRTEATEWLVS